MNERFIVVADKGHLKIYQEPSDPQKPSLLDVFSVDFPEGKEDYFEGDSAPAGRFPGSKGRPDGMSIDERLPMKEEHERRIVKLISDQINHFMFERPEAEWRFAAPEEIENEILNYIETSVRTRLLGTVSKDLVNTPRQELYSHFSSTMI
ncbi:MAG: host attachment protein [Nibricoccus sp.]